MSNAALLSIGLTAERVRYLTGQQCYASRQKKAVVDDLIPIPPPVERTQKEIQRIVSESERTFIALAIMDVPASVIAEVHGVSRECVLQRLRPHGLAHARGRPRAHFGPPSR